MSEQENIKVVEGIIEMVRTNTFERTPEFFHEGYFAEVPGADALLNREQARDYSKAFVEAFPDGQFEVKRLIARGDDVVGIFSWSGTNTGPLPLPTGGMHPPTGRPMKTGICAVYTLRDGKVARAYMYFDRADILNQLGLLPAIESAREVGG